MPVPYPYFELEMDTKGRPVRNEQIDAIERDIAPLNPTDVFVVSHGWNNDMAQARALYTDLFTTVKAQAGTLPALAARRFVVVGLLWPSKKFAEADLIPGGAAGADDAAADAVLETQLTLLQEIVGPAATADVKRARQLVPRLEYDRNAQVEFARIVLGLMPTTTDEEGDPHLEPNPDDAEINGATLLDLLSRPSLRPPVADDQGGAAGAGAGAAPSDGGAAGIGDSFGGIKAGAMNLLNCATYYQMKDRAGVVGRGAAAEAVKRLRALPGSPRVHLVGHSFGARVVTAALASAGVGASTMALLQAAFSHFAFAKGYDKSKTKDGLFRAVVAESRVAGPIVITHTRNDTAVGIAYAIASRVAGQIAAAIGDATDPYGGLGSNGAQTTPEASFTKLLKPGSPYPSLPRGRITNLESNAFIANHGDVRGEAVAYAIVSAIAAAP